ncbi:retropepsin-like aspartic protease [uncultured Psychrosphaera sp.]|uniref:retropepsin-like aspartic protease family protein n=1 Tax=uncultured Psychrosphaera sp. TaxID=1403522 RepID=UPI0026307ED2|nr:retropepsin-like aspartic protease [uncultured Psychrosphaera sp.]
MSNQPKQIGKTFSFIFWGLLLAGLFYFFQDKLAKQENPNSNPNSYQVGDVQVLELQRNRYGHYVTSGMINQIDVEFMLDTGATNVAVPQAVANKVGLLKGRAVQVNTANGIATAYTTVIDQLNLGEIQLFDVKATIVPGMQGNQILLGMNVLKQVEFRQLGDQLTLKHHISNN